MCVCVCVCVCSRRADACALFVEGALLGEERVAPLLELAGVRAEHAEPRALLRELRAEQRHL